MPVNVVGFSNGRFMVTGEGRISFFDTAEEANTEARSRRSQARARNLRGKRTKGKKLTQRRLDTR